MKKAKKYKSLKHRLDANSIIADNSESPCWIWTGAKNHRGYGRINMRIEGKHKSLFAHRVAFEEYKRKLQDDEEVDHLCFTRACINPDHTEAVKKEENLKRRRY